MIAQTIAKIMAKNNAQSFVGYKGNMKEKKYEKTVKKKKVKRKIKDHA